jgi:ferrous iron transport protein B
MRARRRLPSPPASDILLVGQPNVGKSVLFSRLTGVRTMASNYPGTTVSYASGNVHFAGRRFSVVDAPGTYSLEPLDEAARVTVDLLDGARRIINVVDSTHLERHLPLTLELLAQRKSMVVALNFSDEARSHGIELDIERLRRDLGVPVVAITARTGEGLRDLMAVAERLPASEVRGIDEPSHPQHHPHLADGGGAGSRHPHFADGGGAGSGHAHLDASAVWSRVGKIVAGVQSLHHHHATLGEALENFSVHPMWGGIVAAAVLAATFTMVRILGEFLVAGTVGLFGKPWLEMPFGMEWLFEVLLRPPLQRLSVLLGSRGFLHALLIGTLVDGQLDFLQSFGLLTSGLFIPIAVVLPYIASFYLVLGLLEDSGYLPRLAVFLDSLMHRFGLHGYAIIPTLLGMGCNVPGIMATRILESRPQRFIAATMISIAVPCAALQAMIIALVGDRGAWAVALVYGVLLATWILLGLVLRLTVRGFLPELLVEIPPYRLPDARALVSKLWMRIAGFLREALPIVLGAVLAVNLLYQSGLFAAVARAAAPVVEHLWGMPREAIVPLLVGMLRKDVAVGMLAPLGLTTRQLITGCVILSMFFPCIATLAVLFRELGLRYGLASIGVMLIAVTVVGSAVNHGLAVFLP